MARSFRASAEPSATSVNDTRVDRLLGRDPKWLLNDERVLQAHEDSSRVLAVPFEVFIPNDVPVIDDQLLIFPKQRAVIGTLA